MYDFLAIYYIAVFCVLIPYAVVKRIRGKGKERPLPPRSKLMGSVLLNLAILGGLAIVVGREFRLELFPRWEVSLLELGLGLGMLVFLLAARTFLLKWLRGGRRENGFRLLPESWDELPVWILISLMAGFCEELAYRGTLFRILTWELHSPIAGAVIVALAFGVAHAMQGWRSVVFISVLSLLFQIMAWQFWNLYMVMIIHALYDLSVGILTIQEKLRTPALEPEPGTL